MGLIAGIVVVAMLANAPADVAPAPAEVPPAQTDVAGLDMTAPTWRPPAELVYGDNGMWVGALNQRLADAGFSSDAGYEFGRKTRHAVYAVQKHHGLDTTGVFTEEMWPLLDETIRLPRRQERNRVEVDLGKQVLYLVEEGQVSMVLPISSGSGGTYRGRNGGLARANTPEGKFTFERKIDGLRRSYLGTLWNPFYFRGGYAIHGSPSVPNYPASHGCIRLTMWDIDTVKTRIDLGWTIYVYGKRTEPPEPYRVPHPLPAAV